jgi:hypothetical protein
VFHGGGVDTDAIAPFLFRALHSDQALAVRPGGRERLPYRPRRYNPGIVTARSSGYQRGVATESEGRQAVDELAGAGVDFIKVHAAIPREGYLGVAATTKRLGLPFIGHLPRVLSAEEACDAGQAGFEHRPAVRRQASDRRHSAADRGGHRPFPRT